MILGSPASAASMRVQVFLGRRDALARDIEGHARLLELLRRRELAFGEIALPFVVGIGVDLLAERRLDLLALGAPLGAQAADLGALDLDLRIDLGQRRAVGLVVEPEQELAARHALVLAHGHLDDGTADLGGDIDPVALHIGIVGADEAAGAQPGEQGDGDCDQR